MASTIYNGKLLRFKFNETNSCNSCKLTVSSKLEEIATKDTDGTVSIPSGYSLQDRQRHYWQTYLQVIQRMLQQILC
jgi:PP-loop superfamily ATP-utilizing enzyme